MTIESVVYSLLNTTAGISRVYPTLIPRDAQASFAVYTVDGMRPYYSTSGEAGHIVAQVEIEIFAETVVKLNTEFNKIRNNLSGINQTVVGSSTVDGFTIQNVFNSYEPELELHVKTINVDIILTL